MTSISRSIPATASSRYLDPHQEICTGLGAGPPLPAPKEIEDIAEPGEVRGEPAAAVPAAPGIRAFRSIRVGLVTHLVVLALFLGVGEDAVGLVDLLELLLGPGSLQTSG